MVQYESGLDSVFAAVADSTRRGVLDRLGHGEASISALAEAFDMTLTGMRKHVSVLEDAGLVETEKIGRVRICRLGQRRMADEADWIRRYHETLDARLDSLGGFRERIRGDRS